MTTSEKILLGGVAALSYYVWYKWNQSQRQLQSNSLLSAAQRVAIATGQSPAKPFFGGGVPGMITGFR